MATPTKVRSWNSIAPVHLNSYAAGRASVPRKLYENHDTTMTAAGEDAAHRHRTGTPGGHARVPAACVPAVVPARWTSEARGQVVDSMIVRRERTSPPVDPRGTSVQRRAIGVERSCC